MKLIRLINLGWEFAGEPWWRSKISEPLETLNRYLQWYNGPTEYLARDCYSVWFTKKNLSFFHLWFTRMSRNQERVKLSISLSFLFLFFIFLLILFFSFCLFVFDFIIKRRQKLFICTSNLPIEYCIWVKHKRNWLNDSNFISSSLNFCLNE